MSADTADLSDFDFEGWGPDEAYQADLRYQRVLAEQGIGNDNLIWDEIELESDENDENMNNNADATPEVTNGNDRWHSNFDVFERGLPHMFQPRGHTGPTSTLGPEKAPIDFLNLLFRDDYIHHIINETDRYATSEIQNNPDQNKMSWTKPTIYEFKAFLALCFLMGIIDKPEIKMYWATDELLSTPFFSQTMNRDRFCQILRYLHLCNGDLAPQVGDRNYDKLFKVRHFIDTVNESLNREYIPKRKLVVDECMIPFKGRLSFKQYMPKKPVKWGIKCWVLANAESSYVNFIDIYSGKNDNQPEQNLGPRVVKKCMQGADVMGKGHHIYIDNYFTSPELLIDLWENYNTGACGVIKKCRRGLPDSNKKGENIHDRGDFSFQQKGPIVATAWKDKRLVTAVSTVHDMNVSQVNRVVKGPNGQFNRQIFPCPEIVSDYASHMGAVDRMDQYIQYYCFHVKTIKWYKRVFFKVLEIVKFCAFCLFNESVNHQPLPGKPQLTFLKFSLEVIRGLLNGYVNPSKRGRPSLLPVETRLTGRHMPADLGNMSWCHVCYVKCKNGIQAKRRQIRNGCADCRKHLCLPHCYTTYHTVREYWM